MTCAASSTGRSCSARRTTRSRLWTITTRNPGSLSSRGWRPGSSRSGTRSSSYALRGYPCVFSADYYGSAGDPGKPWTAITPMRRVLDKLLELRQTWARGTQRDYFVDGKYIGWTRERGLAVTISTDTYPEGFIDMHVGTANSNRQFVDALGTLLIIFINLLVETAKIVFHLL